MSKTQYEAIVAKHVEASKVLARTQADLIALAAQQTDDLVQTLNWLAEGSTHSGIMQAAATFANNACHAKANLQSLADRK